MSLFFNLIIVAIAWAISEFIDGITHFWYLPQITPLWLIGIVIAGIVALFISEP